MTKYIKEIESGSFSIPALLPSPLCLCLLLSLTHTLLTPYLSDSELVIVFHIVI